MSHFRDVCECGKLLAQCRCIGPKVTNIVRPCTHKADWPAPDVNSVHVTQEGDNVFVHVHASHKSKYVYLPDALHAAGAIVALQQAERRSRR